MPPLPRPRSVDANGNPVASAPTSPSPVLPDHADAPDRRAPSSRPPCLRACGGGEGRRDWHGFLAGSDSDATMPGSGCARAGGKLLPARAAPCSRRPCLRPGQCTRHLDEKIGHPAEPGNRLHGHPRWDLPTSAERWPAFCPACLRVQGTGIGVHFPCSLWCHSAAATAFQPTLRNAASWSPTRGLPRRRLLHADGRRWGQSSAPACDPVVIWSQATGLLRRRCVMLTAR